MLGMPRELVIDVVEMRFPIDDACIGLGLSLAHGQEKVNASMNIQNPIRTCLIIRFSHNSYPIYSSSLR